MFTKLEYLTEPIRYSFIYVFIETSQSIINFFSLLQARKSTLCTDYERFFHFPNANNTLDSIQ